MQVTESKKVPCPPILCNSNHMCLFSICKCKYYCVCRSSAGPSKNLFQSRCQLPIAIDCPGVSICVPRTPQVKLATQSLLNMCNTICWRDDTSWIGVTSLVFVLVHVLIVTLSTKLRNKGNVFIFKITTEQQNWFHFNISERNIYKPRSQHSKNFWLGDHKNMTFLCILQVSLEKSTARWQLFLTWSWSRSFEKVQFCLFGWDSFSLRSVGLVGGSTS